MHLSGSPHAVGVDDDHRVCDAIAARPDAETMHDWVGRFALLADPTRLTLLLCIHRVGEICVTDLALAAGLKDTTCSQALRLLRAQGLVSAQREGRVVRYRLADPAVHDLLHHVLGRAPGSHETAPHETAPHETAPHETAPHETARHETARHETARHDTAQHGTHGEA